MTNEKISFMILSELRERGVANMRVKKKRRKPERQTAQPKMMNRLSADIIAGVISGLITAAILKLLNW